MRDYVKTLAAEIGVLLTIDPFTPWTNSRCDYEIGTSSLVGPDRVHVGLAEGNFGDFDGAPSARQSELVALHELGHSATRAEWGTVYGDLDYGGRTEAMLDCEARAWEWALDHFDGDLGREDWAYILNILNSWVRYYEISACARFETLHGLATREAT